MKLFKCVVSVSLATFILLATGFASVVEKEVVFDLKVTAAKGGGLLIHGTDGNSSFYVSKIREERNGNEINILVDQQVVSSFGAHDGQSGTFDYTLKIPEGVDTVTFGKKKAVIWKNGN